MRIDRIHVRAYGPFTNQKIDLSEGAEGLHVIYGRNEAGKSSMLRALSAWLFGIDVRTRDDFVHSKKELSLEGTLRSSDGDILTFRRIKRAKTTLQDPDTGRSLSETVLAPFLGGLDKDTFLLLYAVDYERLREGSRALLDLEGRVRDVIFGAASGVGDLSVITADLQTKMDELYRSRGKKQRLNKAISEYRNLRKSINEQTLSAEEVAKTKARIEQVEAELKRVTAERKELDRRIDAIRRVKGAGPLLATLREIDGKLTEYADLPPLPFDFGEQVTLARNRAQENRVQIKESRRLIGELEERIGAIEVDGRFLAHGLAERIRKLGQMVGAVDKSASDLVRRRKDLERARREAESVLHVMGMKSSIQDAEEGIVKAAARERTIRGHLAEKERLDRELDRLEAERGQIEAERDRIEGERRAVRADDRDAALLARLVKEFSPQRSLEEDLAALKVEVDEQKKGLSGDLSRLGRMDVDLETFVGLPLPPMDVIESFEDEWQVSIQDAKRLDRELQRAIADRDEAAGELDNDEFRRIPRKEDLVRVRSERDQIWTIIKATLLGRDLAREADSDAGDESQRREGLGRQDGSLTTVGQFAEDYEKMVSEADRIADQLREHAGALERRTGIEERVHRAQERIDELEVERSELEQQTASIEERWDRLWAPSKVDPGTVREMKSWLSSAQRIRADWLELERKGRVIAEKESRLEVIKRSLGEELRRWGVDRSEGESLTTLLAKAEDLVRRADERSHRIGELNRRLDELDDGLRRVSSEIEQRRMEMSQWLRDWAPLAALLGLSDECRPTEVEDQLEQVRAFMDARRRIGEIEKRIEGMLADQEQFVREVVSLAADLGESLDGRDPAEFVKRMNGKLQETQTANERRRELETTLQKEKQREHTASVQLEQATDALMDLCRRGAVADPDELDPLLSKLAEKQMLEQRRSSIKQSLWELAQGRSFEELEAEVRAFRDQNLEESLEDFSRDRERLQESREELLREQDRLVRELESFETADTSAADQTQKLAELAADIGTFTRDYLRTLLAKEILNHVVEDYFQRHRGPALERASELFARLTRGAFAGLDLSGDFKGDLGGRKKGSRQEDLALFGIRAGGKDLVEIHAMSDGTRDQMFLALRLATAVEYMKDSEPMPLILDDLLVGFDDMRTQAALEVFGELASQTQVLVFTHHERVFETAKSLKIPAGSFVHRLSDG